MKKFMLEALKEANKALSKNEVPIGAVIVKDDKIIARGYNLREKKQNAIYHAEMIAINKACKKLNSWRLDDCEMYVTLEPCPMCAGAIANARIKKVVYSSQEKSSKDNLCEQILKSERLNHKVDFIQDLEFEKQTSLILTNFFKQKRKNKLNN